MTWVFSDSFSKEAMVGALDPLLDMMSDIVDKAQQLAKNKIAKLPIAQNQPVGPPMITKQPVVQKSMMDDKPVRRRTPAAVQQYAEWDNREYTSSKEERQQRLDTRDKVRAEMQLEAAKKDLLVYKQMVCELKAVLASKKDRKTRKAIRMEISTNKDIIKTMIKSGVPDVPLPTEVELLIMVDTNKTGKQAQGSKATNQLQAMVQTGEVEPESDKMKNRSNPPRGKGTEPEEEGDDAINCENQGCNANKGQKDSDNLSNRRKPSAEMLDLFTLLDFEDDDEDNKDYEPPVKSRRKRKAVPLVDDDEVDDKQDNGDDDREQDNGDDDGEQDNGDDNDKDYE